MTLQTICLFRVLERKYCVLYEYKHTASFSPFNRVSSTGRLLEAPVRNPNNSKLDSLKPMGSGVEQN
jgi:hypothetical protein